MKKVKYYYNKQSLQFEKVEESITSQIAKIFLFLLTALFFAGILFAFGFKFLDSPKEKQLKRELAQLDMKVEEFDQQLAFYGSVIDGLEERDENIYRTIFEAEPIPASIRESGFGGSDRFESLNNYSNSELLKSTATHIKALGKKLYVQSKSYDEITQLAKDKEEMLSSIPAIQPVANKNLRRMASGYGMRVHPIYKTRKMHWGCDFSAPTGTDIYATGKGKVIKVVKQRRGYGNHVVIDHGYNYKTLYGHMSSINVKEGDKVRRGDIIGAVGNTGTSTAPHLHYEVLKDGKKIDPINFFYNDLSPEEFDQMVEISSRHNQAFD